ncbi:ABC transporter ATP-binding protein [Glutamicibacter sp. MNS18]|uniref:ABC transporter ATP-binding protein n=1 Tax=Glutamicibacter sp. MNS18 TaxID=2989817 RepID=UPI0022360A6D|nr:ABC transporter ATP-binding protein [Glutamicibacter sp. MNS18]MCW4466935.1 ABC transporter ATP-binding protein [Glutamicibacter sp. MNS18]
MSSNNGKNTSSDRPIFEISGFSFAYGETKILENVNFAANAGEFVCIVGPSGAGKTTLLQCLAGLRQPTGGEIRFKGEQVTAPPAELAVVFQDYSRSLMPWLSALQNIALPLKSAGQGKKQREAKALAALEEVGLAAAADLYPWELSGGMQQRVAIARALAYEPALVIMDEPFASVDAQTRADLEDLTLRIKDHLGITVVLVTHDIDEAVYLSDRVVALSGRPATVVDVVDVNLGNQRDQITTKERPEFAGLRSRLYRLIRRPEQQAPAAPAAAEIH